MKNERRRERRVRVSPKYEVKAKVKRMGEQTTHYFNVNNLSFGGLCLEQVVEQGGLDFQGGETLEIMVYRKNLSIKILAEVMVDSETREEGSLRARIVGIDQSGRELLAEFLREMASG